MTGVRADESVDAAGLPFPWGVASGDPTPSSVVLWTRLDKRHGESLGSPGPPVVDWEVREVDHPVHTVGTRDVVDGASTRSLAMLDGVADVDDDGTVRVHLTELSPGTRYTYRFSIRGSWSAMGFTSTLDPESASVRLGIACCARLASGSLVAYEGLRLADPDLVVHLGDYIYEDGGGPDDDGSTPEPPRECRTLADYSTRYAQYRRDERLQALHRSVPWVATPDDHEITDDAFPPENQAGDLPDDVDPPSTERKESALAAHERWMAQHAHGNGPTTFDRHVPLGRVADLIMVDTRLGGRQEPVGSGPTSVHDESAGSRSGQRSLLCEEQWAWLDEKIGAVDRRWLILASQVQVAPLRLGWLPTRSWPPALRPIVNPDQWDGYPADRERLVGLLDRHGIDKVLVLSGDLHSRFVTTIERSDGRRVVEVTTPSVTAPTFASLIQRQIPLPRAWRAWRLAARWLRRINPHIIDMDLDEHGTTLLEVDADTIVITGLSPAGRTRRQWKLTTHGVERLHDEDAGHDS